MRLNILGSLVGFAGWEADPELNCNGIQPGLDLHAFDKVTGKFLVGAGGFQLLDHDGTRWI
jgi:hypothetical protein